MKKDERREMDEKNGLKEIICFVSDMFLTLLSSHIERVILVF